MSLSGFGYKKTGFIMAALPCRHILREASCHIVSSTMEWMSPVQDTKSLNLLTVSEVSLEVVLHPWLSLETNSILADILITAL